MKKDDLMDQYSRTFVKDGYKRASEKNDGINLLWCCFKAGDAGTYPVEELPDKLPPGRSVYFYNDRTDLLNIASFDEVCRYIESPEPWKETDAVISDRSMK